MKIPEYLLIESIPPVQELQAMDKRRQGVDLLPILQEAIEKNDFGAIA